MHWKGLVPIVLGTLANGLIEESLLATSRGNIGLADASAWLPHPMRFAPQQAICSQPGITFFASNPGSQVPLICFAYGLTMVTAIGGSASLLSTYMSSCGLTDVWVNGASTACFSFDGTTTSDGVCASYLPVACADSPPTNSYVVTESITEVLSGTSTSVTTLLTVTSITTTITTQSVLTTSETLNLTSTLVSTGTLSVSVTLDTTSIVSETDTRTRSTTNTFSYTQGVIASTKTIVTSTQSRTATVQATSTLTTETKLTTATETLSSCPETRTSTSVERTTTQLTVLNIVPVMTTVTYTAETRVNCC